MMNFSEENVDAVVSYLNELVGIDRLAVEKLVDARVSCNEAMSLHPGVQVYIDETGESNLGLLGVFNGLLGPQPEGSKKPGWGYIAAVYDEKEELVKFVRADR